MGTESNGRESGLRFSSDIELSSVPFRVEESKFNVTYARTVNGCY